MGYMRHPRKQNKHMSKKKSLLSLRICLFKENQALKFQILKKEMACMVEERMHTEQCCQSGLSLLQFFEHTLIYSPTFIALLNGLL